jgi:hypothetical protein
MSKDTSMDRRVDRLHDALTKALQPRPVSPYPIKRRGPGVVGRPSAVWDLPRYEYDLFRAGCFRGILDTCHGYELRVYREPGVIRRCRYELVLGPHKMPLKRSLPACGARTRKGTPCKARVVVYDNGEIANRCRMHGGLSTGPKTAEGRERIRESNRRRAAARQRERQP